MSARLRTRRSSTWQTWRQEASGRSIRPASRSSGSSVLAPARADLLVPATGAALLAALLVWLGPPGTDLAAHVYQRTLFLEHGFVLWNNFWYSGRYSFVTYSVLYYPLAAVLGIKLLAVLIVAA